MNEQLIQQLSQQIDGQVAQAAGSHDSQVKGEYLWRTYPQVQSCTSYSEAIFLLAQEQAALQQAQSGFGAQAQQAAFGVQHQQTGFGTQQSQSGGLAPSLQFGTPGVPQPGQAAASQFTAFHPPKEAKKSGGKVFGFLPSSVFAVVLIAVIGIVVIGGIVASIVNATKDKNVPDANTTIPAVEETYEPSVDDLFGE